MSEVSEPNPQDLARAIQRDRFVKAELSSRVAALVRENLELLSIVQELQQDLADVKQSQELLAQANGEVRQEQPALFGAE